MPQHWVVLVKEVDRDTAPPSSAADATARHDDMAPATVELNEHFKRSLTPTLPEAKRRTTTIERTRLHVCESPFALADSLNTTGTNGFRLVAASGPFHHRWQAVRYSTLWGGTTRKGVLLRCEDGYTLSSRYSKRFYVDPTTLSRPKSAECDRTDCM